MTSAEVLAAQDPRSKGAQPDARGRLTHRASLNAVALLLDYAAKIVVGLVVTPIMVSGLGRTLFGAWEMLIRLVGYMAATDGRPTEALRMVIANRQEDADEEVKRRLVGSALLVWLLFLPALACAGGLLIWFAPSITRVPATMHGAIRLTCLLLVANFVLLNLVALPEAVLRGNNLGYKRMGLQASLSFLGGILTVAAIRSGAGIAGAAIAQVILTASTGVLFLAVVRRFVAWFGVSRPVRHELLPFIGISLWNLLGALISRVQMSSDIVILGIVASTGAVTTYVLTGYASQAVVNVMTLGLMAAAPGLSGVIGSGQMQRAAQLRTEMLQLDWVFATCVGSMILLWNRSFVTLWVGSQHYAGPVVNLLMVLVMVQTMFIRLDSSVIDGTLQLRSRVLPGGLAALLTLALCTILVKTHGMPGLCAGIILGRLVQTIAYPATVVARLGSCSYTGLTHLLRPAFVTVLLFGASAYLSEHLVVRSWVSWCAGVVLTLAVICAASISAGLPPAARHDIARRLRLIPWLPVTGLTVWSGKL